MSASLNLPQLEAVHHVQGPCLVLAGAGSGKTRVITHKIAHLIQLGLEPERIAAITFTNKAAAEMRERAKQLVGREAQKVLICTFHALGVRMLRQNGEALGLKKNFSILDTDDVTSILKDAGGSSDLATARQWQWAISLWKNQGLNAAMAEAQAANDNERITARIMARYEERLTAYQSVDFDDLIGLPLKLLQQHVDVRLQWQQQMGHVLVDEYQDTNATQYEMLKLLVGERARFTAVGDDDQSIYGWRGATLDNLQKLPVDFPELKVVKLEQNYRSTSAILQAANNVIGPNPKLYPKKLFSELGPGEPVRLSDADNEEHEAERIVLRIQSLRAGNDTGVGLGQWRDWKHFAVLYRANHQSRVLEKAFRQAAIPYKVSGGQSFFDRAEIRDLCAWLRLWVNNDDDPAFLRCVTTPKRGIGHTTLQKLGEFATLYRISMFEAVFSHSLISVLPQRAVDSLQAFGNEVNDLQYRAKHTQGSEAALALLLQWLKDIDYEKHLYDGEDSEKLAAARWTNVLDFVDWMAKRCGGEIDDTAGVSLVGESKTLLEVAQTIALLSTLSEREKDQDVVTLSTLHAAKGLEWPHVVLAGVNEGLLPFKPEEDGVSLQQDALNLTRIQEERR
ncbi:MAG: UvrD-helicase domain-containing protein, partial [Burkholderiales bacterium]|nr:UvrD-helicase domain-containing protein [Burkholderiales bacterium]